MTVMTILTLEILLPTYTFPVITKCAIGNKEYNFIN